MDTYNRRVSNPLTSMQSKGRLTVQGALSRPRLFVIIIAVLVGITFLYYFALGSKTPEEVATEELAAAVAAVGKLMVLPEGDEPVLATVTDAEALTAQQAFFTGAIDGDQLLLFPKSLKAVIYSPSREKIINAGPIEQTPLEATDASRPVSNGAGQNANTKVLAVLTVEVRNGSGVTGRASDVTKSIAALGGFEAHATDATSNDYTKSVVVAIKNTDSARAGANTLASALGAVVVSALPAAEKSSSADIVLILGSDHTQ